MVTFADAEVLAGEGGQEVSLELTPRQIVEELDRYVIGQQEAKRAVAIALRNRLRRRRLPPELRDEVAPKNILMIGPTGVGKTEIARRLARLAGAPFIKVEATKFTEVGYVGRDVESIVRELVETAIRMVKTERTEAVRDRTQHLVEERLVDLLVPAPRRDAFSPLAGLWGMGSRSRDDDDDPTRREELRQRREEVRRQLKSGQLEDQVVEIEVEESGLPMMEMLGGAGLENLGMNLQEMFGNLLPKRKRRRKLTVSEARKVLAQEEAQKLIDMDEVVAEAISRTENAGIVFIDEIDKIAGGAPSVGPDVSREGVQRDILPIVEGSTVMTKYGPVRTDHILFIAAGAFHVSKPSDLIPELQGRFPIRVELKSLTREDFRRILTEPENALLKQYTALLATEGVQLSFTPEAVDEIAALAEQVNQHSEDIGARRLHTIMERLLEELSFHAPDLGGTPANPYPVQIDAAYVRSRLANIVQDRDLSQFIL